MVNTSAIGPVTFHRATARRAFREARSPTRFFRGFRRLRISRESTARLTSIRIWRLSFGLDRAFQKPEQNAAYNRACLREARALKRGHAYRNLEASLVGSGDKGYRCNHFRNNRIYASCYGRRDTRAVFWSMGIN